MIDVTFNYEKKEMVRAYRKMIFLYVKILIEIVLISMLFVYVMFVSLIHNDASVVEVYLGISGILLMIFFVYIYFIWPRLYYDKARIEGNVLHIMLSQDKICIDCLGKTKELTWNNNQSYDETKEFFYLKLTDDNVTVVPKRVLFNEERVNEFRALVQGHLEKTSKKARRIKREQSRNLQTKS